MSGQKAAKKFPVTVWKVSFSSLFQSTQQIIARFGERKVDAELFYWLFLAYLPFSTPTLSPSLFICTSTFPVHHPPSKKLTPVLFFFVGLAAKPLRCLEDTHATSRGKLLNSFCLCCLPKSNVCFRLRGRRESSVTEKVDFEKSDFSLTVLWLRFAHECQIKIDLTISKR